MSTVKFTVTVTIPDDETSTGEERVEAFAKNRGWVAEIAGEPDEEGNPTVVPNPQSATDACSAYFNGILQEQLTIDLVNKMNADLNAARQNGLAQIYTAAKEMIEITEEIV